MKKMLAILMAGAFLLTGCTKNAEEAGFKEVEKIDVEVSDYVEETQTPHKQEASPIPSEEPNTEAVNETPKTVSESTQKAEQKEITSSEPIQQTKAPVKETQKTEAPKQEEAKPVQTAAEITDYSKIDISGKIICIDAGHGIFAENRTEAVAPNSDVLKDGFKEGTKGSNTTEDVITLAVADKLRERLEAKGATVVMTRTDENTALSNVQRAEYANSSNADICIKLHADGTQEGGSGMTMLIPGGKYIADKKLLSSSRLLGQTVLNGAVAKTGAVSRGVYTNSEMAGFNWSKIPVVLLEMGFMTNPADEAKLSDENYQALIADGIVEGILEYYK